MTEQTNPQVHIMWDGRTYDLLQRDLDVGILSEDADIRSAVARELEAPVGKLANMAIDRNEDTEEITLRPQAEFGS